MRRGRCSSIATSAFKQRLKRDQENQPAQSFLCDIGGDTHRRALRDLLRRRLLDGYLSARRLPVVVILLLPVLEHRQQQRSAEIV
jgi:hypothetical protein